MSAVLRARIEATHSLPGVRAGSALLQVRGGFLAVQDDAWCVARVSPPEMTVTLHALKGDGQALSKAEKPDFEAAVAMPDGTIHLIGSGSTAARCAVARITPDLALIGISAMPALYAGIQRALGLAGRPNIEAAVMLPNGHVRLFHRGAGATASASVDLPGLVLAGAAPEFSRVARYALGQVDGIALHITDAVSLGSDGLAFLAAAEDVADAISDGPVAGSVMGMMDVDASPGAVRWTALREPDGSASRRKVEGLVMDADRRGAWVLTDPDCGRQPAQLCRVVLEGFA